MVAELTEKLEEQYPLLASLRIAGMSRSVREPLPRFLGLLMAAAESPDRRGCCFVFPDASRVACTAATLLALSKLTHEFDDLAREYALRRFKPGQRVIVRPTGHVYKYTGVWDLQDGYPDRFKLQVLGSGGARSLPVSEILRLEPTSRKQPKGQVATPLGRPGHSNFDRLLEIAGYGNRALCRNRVMCLTSRTGFEAFVENTELCRPQAGATNGADSGGKLQDILPWGSIREDGSLAFQDHYQAGGEPLLVVTNYVENVAEASVLAEPFSRVVFADGPERLVHNLQACDEIADSQKLIVVANHGSVDALSILEKRDFCIWRVAPEEIQLGREASGDAKLVFFGKTFDAASNYQRLKLDSTDCRDEQLEAAADNLDQVGRFLDRFEGDEEMKRSFQGFFRLLFLISDRCAPPGVQEKVELLDRIDTLEQDVERRAIYVPAEVATRLRNTCTALRELISESTMNSWIGKGKGEALLEILKTNGVPARRRTVIVTRYPQSVDSARQWLQERGVHDPVVWYRHFPEAETFDTIVVLSWLNSERFGKLVQQYAAPEVRLLSYPFEQRWLRQFDSRLSRDRASGQPDRAERSKLLGLPEDLFAPTPGHTHDYSQTDTLAQTSDPFSIFDIEHKIMQRKKGASPAARSTQETCPTRYVGFVGETYTYLTENHEVPVITDLIRNGDSAPSVVPTRTVNGLEIGDFLLFREGSDRDVVRLFAEEMMGPDLYAAQRALAASWRTALLSLRGDAGEVHRLLRNYGVGKKKSTIRNWLVNKNIIGPWKRDDLDAMAAATKGYFAESPEEVWKAIENIRAAHRRAGHRISQWLLAELAGKKNLVADGAARVELDFGQFWIVEVEQVGNDLEQYPAGRVNRLLWENDF